MRRVSWLLAALVVAAFVVPFLFSADAPVRKASGLEKREPWTTSKVVGSPDPPAPYRMAKAYPNLTFTEPLELVSVPGQKLWMVAERPGKLLTFASDPKTKEAKLVVDLKREVYGLALHPKFAENGYIYVTSKFGKSGPEGNRISRFTITDRAAMTADPASEKVVLLYTSQGHSGGCLRFGPDGCLYASIGDGSGIADENLFAQDLTKLSGKILRLDVDGAEDGKGYRIPADNPFVKHEGARGEIWAYGIRQCWKIGFDAATGDLWAADVGQDLWEMVYRIEKGGNYGWSVMEGSHPFRPDRKQGPTPILKPVIEHNHNDFRSITGGFVYHGKRLPELKGHYIYGDYDTGRVWAFVAKDATNNRELVDTPLRIVGWAQDPDGEVYALDFPSGGIYHLVPAPPPAANAPKFPRLLSETGLFTSTKDLTPVKGLIPYSVNAELWSDGAAKERYLAVPGDKTIEYETMLYPQGAPGAPPGWKFPTGTVMVKTFVRDKRRLETRLLVAEVVGGTEEYGDQVWNGYTYIWNNDETDAELADAKGKDIEYAAPTGEKRTWHFPSRAECSLCHTMAAKYTLGVNTLQMNKDHDYGGVVANQLATLDHIGMFNKKLPAPPEKLAKLADYRDEKADLDARARAYLHANCSHCHRKWGGGNAEFQLLATLPLKDTKTVDVKPNQGAFNLTDPRIIVPGHPERSMAHHRMTLLGLGRMPHVASSVVDEQGEKLIRDWIKQMK